MRVTRKVREILDSAIDYWEEKSIISPEESTKLKCSYELIPFDWKLLAQYSFVISIICLVTAIISIFTDQFIIALLKKIFNAPDSIKSLFQAVIAAILFCLAIYSRSKHPVKIFSSDALFFLGVLFIAGSITFLGKAIYFVNGHFPLLILLASIIYGILGFLFRSTLVWSFSIISIGAWFGTETGYASGWGAYYLDMNYPLRFVFFGSVLIGLSFILRMYTRFKIFFRTTYVFGLLYLFVALWILSVFGNYGDFDAWQQIKQIELFYWSILFGIVALACIVYGLKSGETIARSYGLTFLFINLYTRYFEYFWNSLHKVVFFLLLAISFWIVGIKAEKIWSLRFLDRKEIYED